MPIMYSILRISNHAIRDAPRRMVMSTHDKGIIRNMPENPPQYKYDIETTALGSCSLIALLPISSLPDVLDQNPQLASCHHYAICRRPKIIAKPIAIPDGTPMLEFLANHGGDGLVTIPNIKLKLPDLILDDTPPNIVRILDEDGNLLLQQTAAQLLSFAASDEVNNFKKPWAFEDLEVVYVGQALGRKGDRSAVDRLLSHQTLQTILADTLTHAPHLDIWILLMAFESNAISLLGPWEGTQGSDASIQNFVDIYNTPLGDAQLTNLVEGALISYFQPPYNRTFKRSFPAPAHTSYGQVYVLDYNAVSFELSTREIYARIGSKAVKPAFDHTNIVPLHDTKSRRAFFSWFENSEITDILTVPGKDDRQS